MPMYNIFYYYID